MSTKMHNLGLGKIEGLAWVKAKFKKNTPHNFYYQKNIIYQFPRVLDQCSYGNKAKNAHCSSLLYKNLLKRCWKKLKKKISSSIWIAQHPNAGQNIQHYVPQRLYDYVLTPMTRQTPSPQFCNIFRKLTIML